MDVYNKAFELGFHLLGLPERVGGMGFGEQTMGMALEEMARVDASFADTIMSNNQIINMVDWAGTDEQKTWVYDRIIPGGFGAFGLTEPGAGSDSAALSTTAVKKGDKYILNGRKCFITNGPVANAYAVLATVDKGLGHKGITAFLVDKDTPGFSTGKPEDTMGLRSAKFCDLMFEDAEVPVSMRLGEEGQGFKLAMMNLDTARTHNAAAATGLSQHALEEAVRYSKERKQFGKPVGEHEGLKFLLADMAIQIEAGRQLWWNAAGMMDSGRRASIEASMAKCFCGDTVMKVTTDAVQVFGGYGFSKEYPVEKLMRDAKVFQIFEGTNQIHRMIIGNSLVREKK